ncbi:MAG: GntR family transcriptional regulator [Pseudomonadota bacterium]
MSKITITDALTHSDRIVKEIEAEIISGRRAPGSHLNEQEIADRFSVSRTPVREAMRHLSSAGLVDVMPRRGAFVARIPVTRLIQMFETMTELEGVCARLAARRMRADEKRALERIHKAYKKYATNENVDRYYDESLEFHRLILQGAHNNVLSEMATRLFNQLTGYRRRQLSNAQRTQTSFSEHDAVLQAILDGDEAEAERLMRSHTGMVGDNVMDLIGELTEE